MATSESELGTLKWVDDLREAWKHEAQNFTPWLVENLDRLSEVLGIELEIEGSEVDVGPYRADIVARDRGDDSRVLIENQLEDANLQHLGQVLAYLAGLDAKVVVWIAREFDESIRSAISWLNSHSDEEFAFFAIQMRLARIENSPLAAIFEVLEKPNDWDRQVQRAARVGELTELGQFRRNFWAHAARLHNLDIKTGFAGANVNTYIEEADLRYSLYVSYEGVGIFLVGNFRETRDCVRPRIQPYLKPLYDATKDEQMRKSDNGHLFLRIDARDSDNWNTMGDWLNERRVIYERVLREKVSL
ncbi:MAG: hypothetical protein OXR72_14480 [Gemmatimonadota bacterium]|nr:hypothetical protein [Gemmatimonadota bacterium]